MKRQISLVKEKAPYQAREKYDEIAVGSGPGQDPTITVFDRTGTEIQKFDAYTSVIKPGIRVRSADVDFDGVDEIIGFSSGIGL